jgi:DNA-binding phage protein
MKFSRYDQNEVIKDDSNIAFYFDKYLNESLAYNNSNLNTVEGMIEDLAKRTGLKQYINLINAEIENNKIAEDKNLDGQQDSLLDIKEVKTAIDEALTSGEYSSSVNLLKKLEEQIKFNKNIPEYLKNVFSDKKLKDYVETAINQNKQDTHDKIDLLLKDNVTTEQQGHDSYFNFNTNENQK